jgi:hypothetical protein
MACGGRVPGRFQLILYELEKTRTFPVSLALTQWWCRPTNEPNPADIMGNFDEVNKVS